MRDLALSLSLSLSFTEKQRWAKKTALLLRRLLFAHSPHNHLRLSKCF